jgi:hypothetical protein
MRAQRQIKIVAVENARSTGNRSRAMVKIITEPSNVNLCLVAESGVGCARYANHQAYGSFFTRAPHTLSSCIPSEKERKFFSRARHVWWQELN